MNRTYTDEEREAAVELLRNPEYSFARVQRETGIPVGTLGRWAKKAGVERSDAQRSTEKATKAREVRIQNRRGRLKEKLLKYAEQMADRAIELSEGAQELTDKKGEKTGILVPTAKDALAMMQAAQIAFEKFRLESGEPTEHRRTDSSDVRHRFDEKVDELAARRKAKEA